MAKPKSENNKKGEVVDDDGKKQESTTQIRQIRQPKKMRKKNTAALTGQQVRPTEHHSLIQSVLAIYLFEDLPHSLVHPASLYYFGKLALVWGADQVIQFVGFVLTMPKKVVMSKSNV